jgi:hypothetical protein
MSVGRGAVGFACAWLLALGLGAGEGGAAEVYRPRHRLAEELAPVAEAVLGPGGRVAVDPHGGALVLMGDPGAVALALATLRSLDVRPAVWRVETTLARVSDLARAGIRVRGWLDAGSFRIGRAGSLPGGLRVVAGAVEGGGERSFRGEVTVLDGSAAELWTGSVRIERGLLHDLPGDALLPVPTGFRVIPRGRPDGSVELEIASVASEPAPHGGIDYASAATRVVVRPGETLVLASASDRSEASGADLGGGRSSAEGRASTTLLRVDRIDGDAPAPPVSPASSDRSP